MLNDNVNLYALLGDVLVPSDYRWELSNDDGVLVLLVQYRDTYRPSLFGVKLFTLHSSWKSIRELRAPTYGGMLRLLQEWPEFLEFYRASDQPVRRAAISSV